MSLLDNYQKRQANGLEALPYLTTLDSQQSGWAQVGSSLYSRNPANISLVDPSVRFNQDLAQGINPVDDPLQPDSADISTTNGKPAYGGAKSPVSSAAQLDYYLADIAKRYGMDKNTAYQEALSNTSYQRAVADLRAAGLNPVLALGKVTGADSFSPSSSGGGGGAGGGSEAESVRKWTSIIRSVSSVVSSAASLIRIFA